MPARGRDVYTRGGRWWCIVRAGEGEGLRRSTGLRATEPREKAVAQLLEFQRRAREGYTAWSSKAFALAIDGFVRELKRRERSEATQDIARRKAGHFLRIWGTTTTLTEINAKLVSQYVERREREGMAPLTIRRELDVLRGILKWARHVGDYDRDPVLVLPLEYSPRYVPKKRWLPEDELKKLLVELSIERAAHVAFMVAAGARREESFRARRRDVDWSRMMVLVRGTKTEFSHAEIPITRIQEPWLRFALQHAPGKDVLFNSWGNLSRDLHAACQRLSTCTACRREYRLRPKKGCKGCEQATFAPCTPNDLRRTLGHWLRHAGVDPHHIGKMLRHRTSHMAEIVYARGSAEGLQALLNERLGRATRHAANDEGLPKRARSSK